MAKEKSYGAVVFRRDGDLWYLILQYGAGHWDLVKGHGERGESEKTTLVAQCFPQGTVSLRNHQYDPHPVIVHVKGTKGVHQHRFSPIR